ncbi:rhomboid family intramembrane serine protease [Hephaestia caeni]|uniref:rhomboid family intramembrane serine protease n=1 Tax=Hephaestia caeni TaxID=645617 RepID=UPI001FEA89A0|nr:rhomboid family intramembrane serine protease [Hephaestia caeni]
MAAVVGGFIPLLASGVEITPGAGLNPFPAWITPLTATLIHGGYAHLLLNMVMFVYCGRMVERGLGTRGLIILYVVGAYVSAGGQWLQAPQSPVPMVGASGAISAIIAAYALLFSEQKVRDIGPVPGTLVRVAWLAAAWIGVQLLIGLAGLGGGPQIAIAAHIAGFLVGLALTRPLLLWRYRGA